MDQRPDVLVLGGGGLLGEAWMMGVLAGLEDGAGVDLRDCPSFVGTSAGAIVAAHLSAGGPPRRPAALAAELAITDAEVVEEVAAGASIGGVTAAAREAVSTVAGGTAAAVSGVAAVAAGTVRRTGGLDLTAGAAVAPLALGATAAAGALARALTLRGARSATETLDDLRLRIARSRAAFDGRLRIVAVDRRTGRRTIFGSPGAPAATVADAVAASCAVPRLFAPVTIGGREYVDGGVWSPTNLDAAPAGRATRVLCLAPLASHHGWLAAIRAVTRSAVWVEALALRGRGARVRWIGPDLASAAAMGANFMAAEPRGRVLAAGYRQGLAIAQSAG